MQASIFANPSEGRKKNFFPSQLTLSNLIRDHYRRRDFYDSTFSTTHIPGSTHVPGSSILKNHGPQCEQGFHAYQSCVGGSTSDISHDFLKRDRTAMQLENHTAY